MARTTLNNLAVTPKDLGVKMEQIRGGLILGGQISFVNCTQDSADLTQTSGGKIDKITDAGNGKTDEATSYDKDIC